MKYNRIVPPGKPERWDDFGADESESSRVLLILLRLFVIIFVAGMSLFLIVDHLTTKKYMAPFSRYQTSLMFGQTEPRKLIDDPDQVTIFRTAIATAQDIEAHHTHPIDQTSFIFPDEPSKVYLLGRDSSNYEEFWLEAAGSIGPLYLKQFRSQVLTDWLRRNAVRLSN